MRLPALTLALCAPLFACPGDDTGETAASTTSSNGGTETESPTSTGETAATEGSTAAMETSGSTSMPADGTSTGGGPGLVEVCTATCEHLVKCGVQNVPNCGIPCGMIESMVAGCEAEYVAQQECAAALACDDLQAWSDGMMSGVGYPCADEDGAFQGCIAGA